MTAGLPVIAQDTPGVREAADACAHVTLLPLDTSAAQWARVVTDALKKRRGMSAGSEDSRTSRVHSDQSVDVDEVARQA